MGGPGSGSHQHWWRPGKKAVVEDSRSLDPNRWTREGILKAGIRHTGSREWYQDGYRRAAPTASIGYEVNTLGDEPWLRLFYTLTRTGEQLDCRVQLVTTCPRFGGLRWWFVCPLIADGCPCNRRVGKLYLPPGDRYFGCRTCYDLTYTSCQESHQYDGVYRQIAHNIGADFGEVKRIMSRLDKRPRR